MISLRYKPFNIIVFSLFFLVASSSFADLNNRNSKLKNIKTGTTVYTDDGYVEFKAPKQGPWDLFEVIKKRYFYEINLRAIKSKTEYIIKITDYRTDKAVANLRKGKERTFNTDPKLLAKTTKNFGSNSMNLVSRKCQYDKRFSSLSYRCNGNFTLNEHDQNQSFRFAINAMMIHHHFVEVLMFYPEAHDFDPIAMNKDLDRLIRSFNFNSRTR